jgi:predicted GNAT family N-acyltransferase
MTEAASDYRVALWIRGLDEGDLNRCVAVIRAGGAADVDSTKLRAATVLALAKNGDEMVGVGSIKPVRTDYATRIAKKSGFDFPPETPELGYVAVDAAHRGKGLSHRLVAELLRGQKSRLFATTDDRFMKRTLSAAGFVEKGREWKGRRGQLSLWVWEPS